MLVFVSVCVSMRMSIKHMAEYQRAFYIYFITCGMQLWYCTNMAAVQIHEM